MDKSESMNKIRINKFNLDSSFDSWSYDQESKELFKLKLLRKYKTSIEKENYITQLSVTDIQK